jgi:hypothetical protein
MNKLFALIFLLVFTGTSFVNQVTAQETVSRIIEDGGTGP